MANRHLSRSIVLQSLFEWDLNTLEKKAVHEVLERNVSEFAPNKTDLPFIGWGDGEAARTRSGNRKGRA